VTAAKKGDHRKKSAVEIKKGKGYEITFLWTTLKVKDMEESLSHQKLKVQG
jgi:hypothetical protein